MSFAKIQVESDIKEWDKTDAKENLEKHRIFETSCARKEATALYCIRTPKSLSSDSACVNPNRTEVIINGVTFLLLVFDKNFTIANAMDEINQLACEYRKHKLQTQPFVDND